MVELANGEDAGSFENSAGDLPEVYKGPRSGLDVHGNDPMT